MEQAIVMFDGLDEVVKPRQRVEVARRIEDFVARHPGNRFLVTSRIAGYNLAAPSMGFDHYTIAPFEEEEIRKFLRNWYRALSEAETEAERLYQTIAFSPSIKRLAGTPLLLTIIALIHHAGVHLPYRRVELYWLILDALAETWNLARSLSGRPIDLWLGGRRLDRNLVERILGLIAYELHDENPGGLIKHEALVEKVARYFEEYDGKKEEEATRLAEDFVQLAQEQVGILTERGLGLFAFTHLTLEEYLAARYLAGRTKAEKIAQKKLYDPRWEEVLLLTAASLTGEKAERFVREIHGYKGELDRLLQRSLLLAARCLADEAEVRFAVKKQILDDFFETFLSTPYAFLQERSLDVIGAFKGGSSEDYLIEKALTALQAGTSYGQQVAAAEALGELGRADDRIVSTLLEALQGGEPSVQSGAALALGQLKAASPPVLQALRELATEHANDDAFEALWQLALFLGSMGRSRVGLLADSRPLTAEPLHETSAVEGLPFAADDLDSPATSPPDDLERDLLPYLPLPQFLEQLPAGFDAQVADTPDHIPHQKACRLGRPSWYKAGNLDPPLRRLHVEADPWPLRPADHGPELEKLFLPCRIEVNGDGETRPDQIA